MEKFLALPIEKQHKILDGAMYVFASHGYKKASINDIAIRADISKSMIFYYFGKKKNLYLYLVNVVNDEIIGKIDDEKVMKTDDFFEKIIGATSKKFNVLAKYPYSLKFLTSFYLERDEEVVNDVMRIINASYAKRDSYIKYDINTSKFKDGINFDLVLSLLTKVSEGYISNITNGLEIDLTEIQSEFNALVKMLRENLYKEEYL